MNPMNKTPKGNRTGGKKPWKIMDFKEIKNQSFSNDFGSSGERGKQNKFNNMSMLTLWIFIQPNNEGQVRTNEQSVCLKRSVGNTLDFVREAFSLVTYPMTSFDFLVFKSILR